MRVDGRQGDAHISVEEAAFRTNTLPDRAMPQLSGILGAAEDNMRHAVMPSKGKRTSVSMPALQCTSGSAPRPVWIAATMASDVYVVEGSGTMPAADSAVCMHVRMC